MAVHNMIFSILKKNNFPEKIGEKIDYIVKSHIYSELKKLCYKKQARTFYKEMDNGDFHVVNIQGNKWNQGKSGSFTVNLGFYPKELEDEFELFAFNKFPKNKFPKAHECPISERIGLLMPIGNDYWWKINRSTNLDKIGENVS